MSPILQILIKQASGYETYDHAGYAKSRNYNPGKSSIKPGVVRLETGVIERKLKDPVPISTGLPERGDNRASFQTSAPFPTFLHSFSPSISGTGYGRQYWAYKDNPFMA